MSTKATKTTYLMPDTTKGSHHSLEPDHAIAQSSGVKYNVILGCPRSGTTFLFNALTALPYSEAASGHLFPLSLAHIVNQSITPDIYQCLARSFEFSVNDFIEAVEASRVRPIHRWMTQSMTTQELIAALRRRRTIERFIYKEPFWSLSPEFVYIALPKCRIIHIYRDGRDCADSLMRKYKVLTDEKLKTLNTAEMPLGRKVDHRYAPWWVEDGKEELFLNQTPYVRSIWMWKTMVRRCHDFFSRPEVMASSRILPIRYEDLVSEPMKYGEIAANHFGCDMNNLLRKKFQGARKSSISIYKRRSSEEIRAAENIAGNELSLYGYL
ncbi:MAG: sulfotransferase [Cyanobacteria bacterium J06626_6]